MFVRIGIKTSFKNDFGFAFGPTNKDGIILITREDLREAARKEKAVAMMDFGDPEYDATGDLEVRTLNRDALERAIKAYDIYYVSGIYPPRYAEHIQEARIILAEKQPAKLSVDVQATPSEFRIVKKTVSA